MLKKLATLAAILIVAVVAAAGISSAATSRSNQGANPTMAKLERLAKKELAKKNRNTVLEMNALQAIYGARHSAKVATAKRGGTASPKFNCDTDPAFTPTDDTQFVINWRWNGKFIAKAGNTGADPKLLAENGMSTIDYLRMKSRPASEVSFKAGEIVSGSDIAGYASTLQSIQICYAVFKTDKIGEVLLAKSKWQPVRYGSTISYDPTFANQNTEPGTYVVFEGMQVIASLNSSAK